MGGLPVAFGRYWDGVMGGFSSDSAWQEDWTNKQGWLHACGRKPQEKETEVVDSTCGCLVCHKSGWLGMPTLLKGDGIWLDCLPCQ